MLQRAVDTSGITLENFVFRNNFADAVLERLWPSPQDFFILFARDAFIGT